MVRAYVFQSLPWSVARTGLVVTRQGHSTHVNTTVFYFPSSKSHDFHSIKLINNKILGQLLQITIQYIKKKINVHVN